MDISYVVDGTANVLAGMDRLTDRIKEELGTEMENVVAMLAQYVVTNKLSGQVLMQRTGRLAGSVGGRSEQPGDGTLVGVVSADTPYARIQELGGQTKPHVISAVNAKSLHFFDRAGVERFDRRVQHPGSSMQAHYFLRSSLYDLHDQIISDLTDAVLKGIRT